jgi:hypothetical protein
MDQSQGAFERLLRAAEEGEALPYPSDAAEQEAGELYALTQRLHRLHTIQVRPAARQRILARALNAPIEQPQPRFRLLDIRDFRPRPAEWRRAAGSLAAAMAAVAVLTYGTVTASAASLPDSPLYTVKLFVEDVQVAVAPPEQKPQLYTEQAARRLQETEALIESNKIAEAEKSAEKATSSLAAARQAAENTARPDVQVEIKQTTDHARAVVRRLEENGGTAPKPDVVARLQPTPAPPAPPTASPANTPEPTETAAPPTATAVEEVAAVVAPTSPPPPIPTVPADAGAPAGPFATIGGNSVVTGQLSPVPPRTPTSQGALSAPSGPVFVPIGATPSLTPRPTTGGNVGAPVQTYVVIESAPPSAPRVPPAPPAATRTSTPTALPPTSIPPTAVPPTRTPEPTSPPAAALATPTAGAGLAPLRSAAVRQGE